MPRSWVLLYLRHVFSPDTNRVEKCKVMDSKMRPLWLVFQNEDSLGDNILQIFKNGDGMYGQVFWDICTCCGYIQYQLY